MPKNDNKPAQATNEKGEVKTETTVIEKKGIDSRLRNIIFIILGLVLILCLCLSAYLIDLYRRNNQNNNQTPSSLENGSNSNGSNNSGNNTNKNPAPTPSNNGNSGNGNSTGSGSGNTSSGNTTSGNGSSSTGSTSGSSSGSTSGESNNSGNGSTSSTSTISTGHSEAGYQRFLDNLREIERTGVWKATHYQYGDITSHSYIVQRGDTLWWIAVGYYGSGFQWKRIENSNFHKIGYLPNGEHALIWPQEMLNIP